MDSLARLVHQKEKHLWKKFDLFIEREWPQLIALGCTSAATVAAIRSGSLQGSREGLLTMAAVFLQNVSFVKGQFPHLWENFVDLNIHRNQLVHKDTVNRQISYATCIASGVEPDIRFNSKNDTPWYSSYYAFDVENQGIEFRIGISKNY